MKKIKTLQEEVEKELDEVGDFFDKLESNTINIPTLTKKESVVQNKVEILKEEFENERHNITEYITQENKKIFDIKNIPELQVNLYTYRQIIVEKRAKLYSVITKINRNIKNKKRESYLQFKTNQDIYLKNYSELNIFIDDAIKDYTEKLNIIEAQISFFEETINTIDRVIFGIKSRITIEQLLTGITNY